MKPEQVLEGVIEYIELLEVGTGQIVQYVGLVSTIISFVLSVSDDVLLELLYLLVHLVDASTQLFEAYLHKAFEDSLGVGFDKVVQELGFAVHYEFVAVRGTKQSGDMLRPDLHRRGVVFPVGFLVFIVLHFKAVHDLLYHLFVKVLVGLVCHQQDSQSDEVRLRL